MALKDLKGKWVLVTGAASGIGHETALAFAREGANILAIDLDKERLAETTRLIEAMGRRCDQIVDALRRAVQGKE